MNTFGNEVRWAEGGGEFEFCPVACDRNVEVGIVRWKKLKFCPTDDVFGILDDAYYT